MSRLAVVSAGLRSPSSTKLLADQLSEAAQNELAAPVEVTTIEVREHLHAISDALLTGFNGDQLQAALDAVQNADAVIMVTPTFQGSYAGIFKSFVDLIDPQKLRYKPVLLAATGGSERHSLVIEYAMRPLFSYLGSTTVPTGVYAATSDFGNDTVVLQQRIARAASELAVLTSLGCGAVPESGPDRPLDEAMRNLGRATGQQVGDFGDLLRSMGQRAR